MEYVIQKTPKNITKELLYNEIGQEKIMEHYLGVPIKKGLFTCPSHIRRDNKPTCSFYKNKSNNLIFKDFAGFSGDCISVVMHIFNCGYGTALRIVANDFNIKEYSLLDKNKPLMKYTGNILEETKSANIQIKLKDITLEENIWWNSFGVTLKSLKKFKVFSIEDVFLNTRYFKSSSVYNYIFGYYNGKNIDNIEQWKIYIPFNTSYRFLSNWKSNVLAGYKQLPKEGPHLIITKSLKDVMNLYEHNIISVAPNSENVIISENKFNSLKDRFKNIYCFFDNDLAGVKGAKKYKRAYDIKCIFLKRKYAKDISDFYKKSTEKDKVEIYKELHNIIDNNIINLKYFYIF